MDEAVEISWTFDQITDKVHLSMDALKGAKWVSVGLGSGMMAGSTAYLCWLQGEEGGDIMVGEYSMISAVASGVSAVNNGQGALLLEAGSGGAAEMGKKEKQLFTGRACSVIPRHTGARATPSLQQPTAACMLC